MKERINVTKTFAPPIEEYEEYLKAIWESSYFTNQGPLLLEFQQKIEKYLDVKDFHFVTNGTVALQVALRSLGLTEGEIITTPFSYVATTSAILWERCTPVYVDIETDTYNIDTSKIEAAITKNTKAILAVHVFGNPCDVETIEKIAQKYDLKVIYDAAHAFGVTYKGRSLFDYGDISTVSFHSTKLFHTIEGGGLFVNDTTYSDTVELTKRFGHNGDSHILLGMNAKASEFQAAMGLCNLKYIDENISLRKSIYKQYNKLLSKNYFQLPATLHNTEYNYAYYPIVFENEAKLLEAFGQLNNENIFPRRYFYPSLNKLAYISNDQICPISEDISTRIACLPLYAGLKEEAVSRICSILNNIYEA